MATLKVPTLQHLARNWDEDPQQVKRNLVRIAKHPPNFNYEPVYESIREMLAFDIPYTQVVQRIKARVGREDLQENYLSILSLAHKHFEKVKDRKVQQVSSRYYSIARGLLIPFNPVLIYSSSGEMHFPWFSFWMKNPLADKQLSLFVSIVYEVLLQDPDLEDSVFQILDFSVRDPARGRELVITDARSIKRLDKAELERMLAIFIQGYKLATEELAKPVPGQNKQDDVVDGVVTDAQLSLIPEK